MSKVGQLAWGLTKSVVTGKAQSLPSFGGPSVDYNDSMGKKARGLAWALTKSVVMGKAGPTQNFISDYKQSKRDDDLKRKLDDMIDSDPRLSTFVSGKSTGGSSSYSSNDVDIKSAVFTSLISKEVRLENLNLSSVSHKEVDDNFRRVSNHLNIVNRILGGQSKSQIALENSINNKIYSSFQADIQSKNQLTQHLMGQVSSIEGNVQAVAERVDIQDREIENLRGDISRTNRELESFLSRPNLSGGMQTPGRGGGGATAGGGFGLLDMAKGMGGAAIGGAAVAGGIAARIAAMGGPLAALAALGYGTYKTKEFFDGMFGVPDQKFFDDLIAKRDGKAPTKEKEAGKEKSNIHSRMRKYLDGVKERHKEDIGVKPDIQRYNALQIYLETDHLVDAKQTITLKAAKIILDSKELIMTGSKVTASDATSSDAGGGGGSSGVPAPTNLKTESLLKGLEPKLAPGGGFEGAPLGSQGGASGLPGIGASPSFGGGGGVTYGGSSSMPDSMPKMPGGSVPGGRTWEGISGGTVDPGEEGTGNTKKRADVPYNGVPASVRYNNPGASWPRDGGGDEKFGLEGYGIIGGGNRIGKYPTPVHGLASNMDLFSTSKKYLGQRLGDAVRTWRGGNGDTRVPAGFDPNMIVTKEFVNDPVQMKKLFKSFAQHEAGRKVPITDEQMDQAWDWKSAGGIEAAKKAGKGGKATPIVDDKGGTVDPGESPKATDKKSFGTGRMKGVNPVLMESLEQGAVKAFGDPNDENTRYVIDMQHGVGSRSGKSKHPGGNAVDLQIFDRQTGKHVGGHGGSDSIFKNAFGNAETYRMYEVLGQARYQYMYEKYGKDVADKMTVGTRFRSRRSGYNNKYPGAGATTDAMHYSVGEGQSLGRIDKAANKDIQEWLAAHGAEPSQGMGDDILEWKSPYNSAGGPKVVPSTTKPELVPNVPLAERGLGSFVPKPTFGGSTEQPNAMPTLPKVDAAPAPPALPKVAAAPGIKTAPVVPPPSIPKDSMVGKPHPRATPGKPMAAPGSINKPLPPGIPTGRGANPAKAMARKSYDDKTAARGGAPSGGGISGDAGRTTKPSDAKASETAATKGSDVKGDTNIQVPRHDGGDSNPPSPGDDGTGSYDTTCFV